MFCNPSVIKPLLVVLLATAPLGCGGADSTPTDASGSTDGGNTTDGAAVGLDGGSTAKDTNSNVDSGTSAGDAGISPLTFFDDGVFRSGQPEAYLTNATLLPANNLTISSALANNTGSIRIVVYQASGSIAPGTYPCAPGTVLMSVSTVNPSRSFSAAQGSCSVVLSRVSGRVVGTFTGSLKAPLDTTVKAVTNGQFDLPL